MIRFDSSADSGNFWDNNLKKYQQRQASGNFPQNLIVTSLMKLSHRDVAVFKGHLENGDFLIITHPTFNYAVKNFIGIGIADCEYSLDNNVQVYELDYDQPMTDDFVFNLLTNSHGWVIKDYGDLSGY
jgi:hypothetical protein